MNRVASLAMELVKLLQIVQVGTSFAFHGIQFLDSSAKSEYLDAKEKHVIVNKGWLLDNSYFSTAFAGIQRQNKGRKKDRLVILHKRRHRIGNFVQMLTFTIILDGEM
jgi:hypothetical protein